MSSRGKNISTKRLLAYIQPGGVFSSTIPGFESRAEQQQMMSNIIDAYNDKHITIIEAGTGTGKSLAYLLPALLWAIEHKERTLVATNTIALQEQLLLKDIPKIIQGLNLSIKAVLIKGMGNYVCLRKMQELQQELPLLTPKEQEEATMLTLWGQHTQDGSKSDLPSPPSHAMWERIHAESDTCNHHQCPHYQKCFFFKARREAADANILVANHHLLFADLAKRAETNNYADPSVLPVYHKVIIDEAHHIGDVATEYFASRVSRLEMFRILARLASEGAQGSTGHGKLPSIKFRLMKKYGPSPKHPGIASILTRLSLQLPDERRLLLQDIGHIFHSLSSLTTESSESGSGEGKLRILPQHREHPQWKEQITPALQNILRMSHSYIQSIRALIDDISKNVEDSFRQEIAGLLHDTKAFAVRLENACVNLHEFIMSEERSSRVRWIESQQFSHSSNVSLINAELDIAPALAGALFTKFDTVVLCSATMTTNGKFDFMRQRLGLVPERVPSRITEYTYDSPFDYAKQAMLIVPTDLPQPTDPKFVKSATEQIWNALQASQGHAFVLFTSYTMLKECYELLEERMQRHNLMALKQGDDSRNNLIHAFKQRPNTVLFGTDSFWEGIDVAGDALRCVIIVKLPFKVPTEPMTQARMEDILAKGGDPFLDYSLPAAIIKFKQGFGRLIRHRNDRGCVVCLDPRLHTKAYGKVILNSLPRCEQVFQSGNAIQQTMRDFYRKTYHLVVNK